MKFKEQIYKQLSTRVRCPASASKENSTKWTFIQRLFSWKTCLMHKNQCLDAWNWRKLPWSPWRRLWACLRNYRPLDSWTRTTTSLRFQFFREVANCLFLILLLYHNQYTYYDSTKKRALCGRLRFNTLDSNAISHPEERKSLTLSSTVKPIGSVCHLKDYR